MPDVNWHSRVERKIDRLLATLEVPTEPPGDLPPANPGVLLAPTSFAAVYNTATRTVTCSWDPQSDLVELHELVTDPTATLKATLGPGVTARVSSPLDGGHPYVWAARSVRANQVSVFTWQITTMVPLAGGSLTTGGGS